MKTVYFHIGTSKTGTSAIQAFLDDNQEVLKTKGYCYQVMPLKSISRASIRRNAHFMLENVMDENGKIDEGKTRERIQDGYQAIEGWLQQSDHIILTDESFWGGMNGKKWQLFEELKAYLDARDVVLKIIVYFRKQEDYMLSWWKQMVRVGKMTQDWEGFVDHPKKISLNYTKKLKTFEKYVGTENVIVRLYEKGKFRGEQKTIFSDFLEAIDLEFTDEYVVRENKVNTSLTENYAEIKRNLNILLADENYQNASAEKLFEKVVLECSRVKKTKKQYSMFSEEEQKKIWEKYKKSNTELKEKYFPDEESLFEMKTSTLEKWIPDNEDMLSDIVIYFGALAVRQQEDTEKLREQIKELNQIVINQNKQIKELKRLEEIYKNNKGELKALKTILAPIKWIWRKIHDFFV